MGSSLGGAGLSELENPENEELFIPPISRPTYWSQCSGPAKNCDIATVNNPAMIELQKLSTKFEADNPDIQIKLGRGGRKHPAPACDDRRLHGKRAVRLSFHRSL